VFGIGKDQTATAWKGLFRQLIAAGLLTGDEEGHGTVSLTDSARPVLRGEQKFLIRVARTPAKKEKAKREARLTAKVAPQNETLLSALRALRLKLASAAGLPPYVVAQDRTLVELAEKRPHNEDQLHDIMGLGASKIARYGKVFLETIAQFKPNPLLNNKLSATVNQTLAGHLRGLDAEAIAAERRLDVATIYGHFAEAIEAGLLEARQVLSLDEAEIDEIIEAFDRCHTVDSGKLGPAHAALEGRYDYGVLKCMLAELA
jgi:ATP-dependent DNA helicase RecQ